MIVNDEINILYDMADGYLFDIENVQEYAKRADYYFKRSISDIKRLCIGQQRKNCHGLSAATIDYAHCWLIEIGDNVTFAPQVYLLAHDASTKRY